MTATLQRHGRIAVVTIDNPPVNALSTAVRARLLTLAMEAEGDPEISAVVLTGAGRLFVGGADIAEFDRPPEPPTLPDLTRVIERAAKPWTAALNGLALGGGLELALACRFRVAAPGVSVGLPEVTLGIIPGAGGTQRLPRLIGLENAIPVVAEKAMPDAARALDLGLIDRVIGGPLLDGALAFAAAAVARPLPPVAVDRPLADPGAAFWQATEARIAGGSKGQSAPVAALRAVRHGVENGVTEGLRHERETFLRLKAGPESAALRHLFFAERAAPRPASLRGTAPAPVQVVGVVGGGTMGRGIAAAMANAGLSVVLSERDDAALAQALAALRGILDAAARRGLTTVEEAAARMARVAGITGLSGLAPCDLVIEAVYEDLQAKCQVFAALGAICRPDAILATNTSYLDPRRIAEGVPGPQRVVGLHFFSPAQVMKLLEIVPLPETSQATLATAFDLARRLGKIPVRSGICEGFIGNRILKRTRAETGAMLAQGVHYATIDRALRGFGQAMGPFEMQDMAGLDISFLQREAARAAGQDVPETAGDLLVRAGRLGQKSGAGWYDYVPGDRSPRPSAAAEQIIAPLTGPLTLVPDDGAIVAQVLAAMADEGQRILDDGIAAGAADIDLVMVHGYGFPRTRGGPMFLRKRADE